MGQCVCFHTSEYTCMYVSVFVTHLATDTLAIYTSDLDRGIVEVHLLTSQMLINELSKAKIMNQGFPK